MARKLKLPKRIAGVKIPKSIRKGPVGQFVSSSAGQLLIAEALLAAAGAYAARRTDPDSRTGAALRHPVESLKEVGRSTASAGKHVRAALSRRSEVLSFAVEQAVQAFRDALEQGRMDRAMTDLDANIATESRVETTGAQRAETESPKKKSPASAPDLKPTTPH